LNPLVRTPVLTDIAVLHSNIEVLGCPP